MEIVIDFGNTTHFYDKYNVNIETVQAAKIVAQLTELRIKSKITQTKLAKATGLTQPQISKIEKGEVSPNIETVIKIADYFNKEIQIV
ncbi:helix-turn-helix transcriptional regulator [Lactococcus lactis]|uniref:helix-turn-helix domain-containing protein n=1 Tax=Lactococcus lactis TaxID=1358 RepID=UPI0024189F94|nr:helix-turn-helix transcriptional regulator [Lactococcus lactis]MDG4965889.1 helix-turn-helix transcriptional regulator [Lactococcus lactis]